MNILYRIPYPNFFSQHGSVGGHVTHALGIVGGFIDGGHSVTVLTHENRHEFVELGARTVCVPGSVGGGLARQRWLMQFFARSRELLDVGFYTATYTRYSASAVVHLASSLLKDPVPGIVEINSLGSQHFAFLKPLDRILIRCASLPIVVSTTLHKWVSEYIGEREAASVKTIANGVALSRFRKVSDRRFEPNARPNAFRCAFAGLIKPYYGLECLLESAKLLQGQSDPVSFHIYGAGPAEQNLRVSSRDVDNFTLEGAIPFEQVPDYLSKMDCLVYTTSHRNSFQSPTKLFEYMAIGSPIVAARTAQTEEILEGGKLGVLFDLDSPKRLVEAISEVRGSYSAALERARLAQEVARREHSWKSRVDSIMDALDLVNDE